MTCDCCHKPVSKLRILWMQGGYWILCDDCATWASDKLRGRRTAIEKAEADRKTKVIEEARGEG